jgi:processive 1,2-diacylglycerol beta-glucosyltransferase
MRPRILILTAGFGEGHNAAARALAEAFEALRPGSAQVVDVFALASPRLNAVLRRAYLRAINGFPRLWSAFYRWVDRPGRLTEPTLFLRSEYRVLDEWLQREPPDAICCTFPAYAFLLEKRVRRGRKPIPHYNIVTDSISIHSLWWRAGCDGWFLPNEDSAAVLRAAGLDPARLTVTGFPVARFFAAMAGILVRPELAAGAAPRILYIINSGTRNALATARLLLEEPDWEVTCAVGRDEPLRQALLSLAAGRPRPAEILGWTDRIPRLLMTHHVVVSKAGGATTQEAIAARCPMIVTQVVPGQEEGNYELLRRHGVGGRAETPEALRTTLRQAFADRGATWSRWQTALEKLAQPDAARTIATRVLARLPAPEPAAEPVGATTHP